MAAKKTLFWIGSTSPVWVGPLYLDWGSEVDAELVQDPDDGRWADKKPRGVHDVEDEGFPAFDETKAADGKADADATDGGDAA